VPNLETLFACVNFVDSAGGRASQFFQALLSSPRLKHLDLASTAGMPLVSYLSQTASLGVTETPLQDEFIPCLALAPYLESFVLTRTKIMSEEMTSIALRIASDNPTLKWFILRDVVPLDHEDRLFLKYRTKQISMCAVMDSVARGELPNRRLRVRETRVTPLGQLVTKSHTKDIPPPGSRTPKSPKSPSKSPSLK
jgi:hypothetical protein